MCKGRVTGNDLCRIIPVIVGTFVSVFFVYGYPPGSRLFNQGAYFTALMACLLMIIEVSRMVQAWPHTRRPPDHIKLPSQS